MIMFCGVHPNETMYISRVEWKFQSIKSTQTELLFNGYTIMKSELDLFVRNDTGGEFNLEKNRTQLKDAGAYHCLKRIPNSASIRTETNIAQLTILESDPVCGSNTNNGSVVEGDHLRMWCSVNYSGNLDPVMEWSRSDGTIVYSTVIYTNDTFPQTVTSTSIQMMNYSDNDVLYICKTYFKIATVDSQREGSSSATNAPDYQAECNLTVNVLFGPRDLSISPTKTTYYNGDSIHCSASGNPPPAYEWTELDTGYVVDGPTLIVDNELGEPKTKKYQCKAENVVFGEKKIALEDVQIHIAGGYFGIGLMHIAIMMGIVCALLLIIVIYFGRQHIKGCIGNRASSYRRGSGTEPDVLPNADGTFDTSNYDLELCGQSTMLGESAASGVASTNWEQKIGHEVRVEVPVYADIDQISRHNYAQGIRWAKTAEVTSNLDTEPEEENLRKRKKFSYLTSDDSEAESDSLAVATKKQTSTKLSTGLDGTVYLEINSDRGLHRQQASGALFQSPMFDKSEYASIDHTIDPSPAPRK